MDYTDINGKQIDIKKKAMQHIKRIKEEKERKAKNKIVKK